MKRRGRTIVPLAVILLALLLVGVQADAASPQVAVGHSPGSPDLAIAKTHSGSFTRGQTGATYTITVSNVGNGPTTQAVSVTDTLPTGLTATDISGTGWSCTLETLTCTRSDTLSVLPNVVSGSPQALPRTPVLQGSYPVITVTVTVAGDAPSSVTNQASVSGGGDNNNENNDASDITAITGSVGLPDLTLTKSHTGNFTQGQIGATYTLTVSNSGAGSTSGTVTVTDTLPSQLTATDISGTGWSCILGTLTCTRNDTLTPISNAVAGPVARAIAHGALLNGSYPVITVTVNVAVDSRSSITNNASVSGGGETNTNNDSASDVTTVTQVADLIINKFHIGNFTQGQTGAIYTIDVSNRGVASSSGTVTVTDTLPTGLTATDISGTGWSCTLGTLTCTRNDTLTRIPLVVTGPVARTIAHGTPSSGHYPVINVTVNVAGNAASSITNNASVSGGGEVITGNDTATDVTTVLQPSDLTIASSHTGNFSRAQTGATYSLTVSNSGTGATSGTVTVTDTLPTGLTATGISGTGWSCILGTLTCTRSDALSSSTSYPVITVTVNVANDAASSVTNAASVSGGGEINTENDSASDVTSVGAPVPLATTTTLAISPNTSVNAGATLTFTATVQQSSTAVTPGVVTFCDANASHCTGTALLGTAQLNSAGTATLSRVLSVGTYNVKALFAGTPYYTSSESEPQSVAVTGNGGYGSTTTIASSGSVNSYTLTGTVTAFGKPIPTGLISFIDTTTGNSVLATATLDPTTLGFTMTAATDLAPVDGSPLPGVYGDFNNDGKVDLAIPNGSTNAVSVLLGNGDGTFQPLVTYATEPGGQTHAIAVGDFNGDGNQDLVVTNIIFCDCDTVSVLLGNGDGTFQPQVTYGVGYQAYAIVVGDFNGDGDADLAVANRDDNNVGILLGNGDGTFKPQTTVPVLVSPVALATGDLNNDGQLDLIVVNRSSQTISELMGNGDGTFQEQVLYPVGNSPAGVVVTDLNGDGNPDVAVTNTNDNTISTQMGRGDGSFSTFATLALGISPGPLTVGDFDGDGIPDLATLNTDGNVANVLFGNGDGTFKDAVTFAVGSGPAALTAADFNGDGLTDLATLVNGEPLAVAVLLSQHTETATSTGVALSGPGTHNVLASYAGDDSHEASQSETIPLVGPAVTSTTTVLTASTNPVNAGQTVTFTATVSPIPIGSPAGTVSFYSGSTLLGTAPVNGSGIATLTSNSFTAGTKSIAAVYSGNTAFTTSTSSPLSLVVQSATVYTITASKTPFTVKAGGSVAVHIVVPPVGGSYNSLVTMSASGLPAGAVATFNPQTVTPGASGAPTVMTIQTAAASAYIPANPSQRLPFAAISMAAAAFIFIGKRKRIGKSAAMLLLAISVVGGALMMTGCDGGFVGTTAPQSHTYVITITGTSGNLHPSTTITLIVQ